MDAMTNLGDLISEIMSTIHAVLDSKLNEMNACLQAAMASKLAELETKFQKIVEGEMEKLKEEFNNSHQPAHVEHVLRQDIDYTWEYAVHNEQYSTLRILGLEHVPVDENLEE